MLVLTRDFEEEIVLRYPGVPDVVVKVLRQRNLSRVKVAIDAPDEVLILRRELADAIEGGDSERRAA